MKSELSDECRLSREEHRLSKDCDFGRMSVYGGIVSDSVPPFENLLTDANRQKALKLERQNLTNIEQDLRRRETETASFAMPPFARVAPVPGPGADLS